ncbi:MAG TPA: methionyl-tRNA formyltransferase [Erysipelotrichaceae bacterium]|nr:methionyl-tRNA formyltransferase [Erysipelotrichaceae bacterium]
MDKKRINLLFMGTPQISAYVFEALIVEGYHFVGLVCQPDQPVGRKGLIEKVPTKVIAEKYNIPVFQPLKIKEDYSFMKGLDVDLVITFAYGQIVPQGFLDIPPLGCLNLHGSLLPKYRGASPVQTVLFNRETVTGVTLMEIIKEMDAGRIYGKKEVLISEEDNATSLFIKIQEAAKELIISLLPKYLKGELKGEEQDDSQATYCSLIKKEQERIDLNDNILDIWSQIRGLSLEPGAYLFLDGQKIKIYQSKIINNKVNSEVGTIIQADKKGLVVQLKDGQLALLELQKEGKKKMDYRAFVNGHRNLLGQKFI